MENRIKYTDDTAIISFHMELFQKNLLIEESGVDELYSLGHLVSFLH